MSDVVVIVGEPSPADLPGPRPSAGAVSDPDRLRSARRTARWGAALMISGPPLLLIGGGIASDGAAVGIPLFLAGVAGTALGPPLLAAGHLDAQRLLAADGYLVSPSRGRVAMGSYVGAVALFGASFVLGQAGLGDLSGFYAAGGGVVWLGSGVFAALQGRENRRALGVTPERAHAVALVPRWEQGPGLLLVVTR